MAWFSWPRGAAMASAAAWVVACAVTDGVVGPGSGTLPNGDGGSSSGGSSSGAAGDAATCAPADESTFTPTWHAPHPHQADCDAAQLDSLFACIRDAANDPSAPSCVPWGATMSPANKTCYACVLTDDTQTGWGPLIVHTAFHTQETNFAGCAAILEGRLDGTGCGGQVNADVSCGDAACAARCPVDKSGAGIDALNTCLASAEKGTCARFATGAACLLADGGPLAKCDPLIYADDLAAARAVAAVFCGGGAVPDAGGD